MRRLEKMATQIVSSIFRVWPQSRPSEDKLKSVRLVAHRGLHENAAACENSLQAFRLAAENGIWAIEFDVRFTADDVPVILHDPDCTRLHKRADLTLAQISSADLRRHLPQIPRLEEVVQEFKGRLHFMIEIKEDLREHPRRVTALAKALENLTAARDYHLLALQPDLFTPLVFAPRDSYMDVIWLHRERIMRRNQELGHGAIAGHFLHFRLADIKKLQAHNKRIGVGFIDSRNSLYREVHRGADFIFTNHPLRLKKFLLEAP